MAKKQTPRGGHWDLYLAVRRLYAIVHRERKAHPRTKVWKDLEEITEGIDKVQKDWFQNRK